MNVKKELVFYLNALVTTMCILLLVAAPQEATIPQITLNQVLAREETFREHLSLLFAKDVQRTKLPFDYIS
jgi:hypothetical protein